MAVLVMWPVDMPLARATAEDGMTSTCSIRARGTETTTDPDTGAVVAVPGAERYAGKCRVRPAGRDAQEFTTPGDQPFSFDYLISVPFSVAGIQEHDRLTITASPDPALVGIEVEIQKVDRGEHISARRLACQEVS